MRRQISERLREIEQELNARVLYACESGSRAWGFASEDSDYDVRFIYVHSVDWYLRLEKRPDNIERFLPDDLDVSGWELSKTLRLFSGCNLALNEWLGSPVVYETDQNFLNELKALIPKYFNPKKAMHHYLSMADKTTNEYLLDNTITINIKKLFYILRPLLACEWITVNEQMPPTEFQLMLGQNYLPPALLGQVNELLGQKSRSKEQDTITISDALSTWIKTSIEKHTQNTELVDAGKKSGWEPLNMLMRKFVN